MAHRALVASLVLVLAVSCGGGDTSGAEAFCDAARDAAAVAPGDLDQTLDIMKRLREEAPDEIQDAVDTLADATTEAARTHDQSIVERQEVKDASADLDAYLQDNCEAPE